MAAPQMLSKEERIARDTRIWELRCQGWTQRQIGQQFGISHNAVGKVLAKQRTRYAAAHQDNVDDQLTDEAAALDEQIRVWTERALSDSRGAFRAGELVLRFRESRRKLLGLDRPAKVDVTQTIVTPVDVEIASLMADLGLNDPSVTGAANP